MIKNIIFDMGNVLIRFDMDYLIEKSQVAEEDRKILLKAVFQNGYWLEMDWGRMTEADAYEQIKKTLPERLHEAARKLVFEWDQPIFEMEGMYELIEELKEKGRGIYLLSNASVRQPEYWPRIPASCFFDGAIVSAQVGMIKPNADIYQKLFETFALNPEECYFIDDRQENIAAANALGMRGFVFQNNVKELRTALKAEAVLE